MALKKQVTFINSSMKQVTGEYWRITQVSQQRGVNCRGQEPIAFLELWENKEAAQNPTIGDIPLWSGAVPLIGIDINNYTMESIYEWLKQNYQPLLGAQDE